MAGTQEREELRRLVDELPDEAVHNVLQVARAVSSPDDTARPRQRPAWIGAGHHGPDYAANAKDVLQDEMRRSEPSGVPSALRSFGLTVREYEVLRLLADRLGNLEIAHRLHLSPDTVAKYVSNLMTKTGSPDRIALSEYAETTANQ